MSDCVYICTNNVIISNRSKGLIALRCLPDRSKSLPFTRNFYYSDYLQRNVVIYKEESKLSQSSFMELSDDVITSSSVCVFVQALGKENEAMNTLNCTQNASGKCCCHHIFYLII